MCVYQGCDLCRWRAAKRLARYLKAPTPVRKATGMRRSLTPSGQEESCKLTPSGQEESCECKWCTKLAWHRHVTHCAC